MTVVLLFFRHSSITGQINVQILWVEVVPRKCSTVNLPSHYFQLIWPYIPAATRVFKSSVNIQTGSFPMSKVCPVCPLLWFRHWLCSIDRNPSIPDPTNSNSPIVVDWESLSLPFYWIPWKCIRISMILKSVSGSTPPSIESNTHCSSVPPARYHDPIPDLIVQKISLTDIQTNRISICSYCCSSSHHLLDLDGRKLVPERPRALCVCAIEGLTVNLERSLKHIPPTRWLWPHNVQSAATVVDFLGRDNQKLLLLSSLKTVSLRQELTLLSGLKPER